jgi:MOSC domain-containing protein
MHTEIGYVEAIFRYPVKSMAGERLEHAHMGWYGIDGDRRLALRRVDDRSGMPWLTASKLPELLLFSPHSPQKAAADELPSHILTPGGEEVPVLGEELANEVAHRYGAPVQMMHLRHGIFDEAPISVIASDTVREIGRLAGKSLDIRCFRPNVVVRLLRPGPFLEDQWLGDVLSFGQGDGAPAIAVTMRDERCAMVNLDPDSAEPASEVMKAIVRVNQNNAGVYGAVTRTGRLAVGDTVFLGGTKERKENG